MFTWFTIIFSGLWTFLKPVLIVLLNDVKDEVLEFALETVTELSAKNLTSWEKKDQAFELIKGKLEEEGKEVADSSVNLLLEMAVSKLKAEAN